MKKIVAILILFSALNACSVLSHLSALTKCEFSFRSAQDPTIAGVDVMRIHSFSDLSLLDGQKIASNILQKKLPFGITANIEAQNPGSVSAAVNTIDWIAFIDDIRVSAGRITKRIEIPPNGGTAIIPIRIETDLFEYLKGDNPKTMLNFGLNLIDAGGQPTRLSLKIKPSIVIKGVSLQYPDYFTLTKDFTSGN